MSKTFYFFSRSEHDETNPLDGKFISYNPPANKKTTGRDVEPLSNFVNRYWFVELPGGEHRALSTEEIANKLRGNQTLRSVSGPFPNLEEAARSLERYWEMLMDKEDK